MNYDDFEKIVVAELARLVRPAPELSADAVEWERRNAAFNIARDLRAHGFDISFDVVERVR